MKNSAVHDEDIESILRRLALLNAVAHGGSASVEAIVGRVMAERSDFRQVAAKVRSIAVLVVEGVNGLTPGQQLSSLDQDYPNSLEEESNRKKEASRKDSETKSSLPALTDAIQGKVVTRFPPEPNGFMHVGHAKAAFLGSEYSRIYEGRFILRFDDTNPAAEKKEFYDAFLEAFEWLGLKPDQVRRSSDDMEIFYELAEKMIKSSAAYVCACPQDVMRDLRSKGEACLHRSQTVEENELNWFRMKSGETEKAGGVLRFVGDMTSPNTTMRDPVLFRIVVEPHPVQGCKYRVWPTYDFDGPVEDSLDGVTHAMRSKEYELRDELYHAILKSLGLRRPEIIEFSRLVLKDTTMSKRNLRKLVDEEKVEGWDDPRLPTIFGLRRRGFVAEAIKRFILSMGVSKVESEPTWDLLESMNRKILDGVAKRYFFVPDPVEIKVEGAPSRNVRIRYHPEHDYGDRLIKTEGRFFVPRSDLNLIPVGAKARLIDAYNVRVILKKDGKTVCEYVDAEDLSVKPKIQWVSAEDNVALNIKVPGPLLLDGQFNNESLKVITGLGEETVSMIEPGTHVQFVRFGFCRMDTIGTAILTHK